MEYEKKAMSSGTAKAALALGVTGTALATIFPGLLGGGGFAGHAVHDAAAHGGHATGNELSLVRELASKDGIIAQLAAEKYADAAVATVVTPLAARVCELEKDIAVNRARDRDFRTYVEREFIHQPKAYMPNRIVTTEAGCCDTPTE